MSTDPSHWRGPWLVALCVVAGAVHPAAAPEPPAEAQAAHQVTQPDDLATRLLGDQPAPVRSLDPAIFIELSPVTAAEPPVRLPDDQQEQE